MYQGLGQMLTMCLQHHQGCPETPKCAYVIYGQPLSRDKDAGAPIVLSPAGHTAEWPIKPPAGTNMEQGWEILCPHNSGAAEGDTAGARSPAASSRWWGDSRTRGWACRMTASCALYSAARGGCCGLPQACWVWEDGQRSPWTSSTSAGIKWKLHVFQFSY